ncbi:hypothetical protein BH753_gp042 [Bacillus phage Shbh1]|uniref:Uncharacterized protein n=1 Tax=Bacillus phage Shbh1 TaxID=1796992 RepID=A0A142F167_9CAUD|nr:hypothetical protein BH753_gp042 [Bacillus phage Shbh1]AMQ66524.1 hypothetical protein [Bacillus phage Shbh1]
MGMDVYVVGVKSPTEEHKKKVEAYRACEAAGIEVPSELEMYFDYTEPSEDGMEVSISEAVSGDVMYDEGVMTIDLSKLPSGVTHIKVIGSY